MRKQHVLQKAVEVKVERNVGIIIVLTLSIEENKFPMFTMSRKAPEKKPVVPAPELAPKGTIFSNLVDNGSFASKLQELVDMGFDREKAKNALLATNENTATAVDLLTLVNTFSIFYRMVVLVLAHRLKVKLNKIAVRIIE